MAEHYNRLPFVSLRECLGEQLPRSVDVAILLRRREYLTGITDQIVEIPRVATLRFVPAPNEPLQYAADALRCAISRSTSKLNIRAALRPRIFARSSSVRRPI